MNELYFVVKNGVVSVLSHEPPQNSVSLEPAEESAVRSVFSSLEAIGVCPSSLFVERTESYLKISAHPVYKLCFCRLKLFGRSPYIELTISVNDAKALSADPRFSSVNLSKPKRFTRIPIASAADVLRYSDVIRLAFSWGTTVAAGF